MGADLILAIVAVPKGRPSKGKKEYAEVAWKYIDSLTDEQNDDYELDILVSNYVGDDQRSARLEDNAEAVTNLLVEIDHMLSNGGGRDDQLWALGQDWYLFVTGGTTAGDDPSVGFTLINWLSQLPGDPHVLWNALNIRDPGSLNVAMLEVPKFEDVKQADDWMEEVASGRIPKV